MQWVLTRGKRRRRNRLQGSRLHLGMVADIKSERWPASSRKRWPACVGIRILRDRAAVLDYVLEALADKTALGRHELLNRPAMGELAQAIEIALELPLSQAIQVP